MKIEGNKDKTARTSNVHFLYFKFIRANIKTVEIYNYSGKPIKTE